MCDSTFGGFENFEAFEPHDAEGERDAYYEEQEMMGGHDFDNDDGNDVSEYDDEPLDCGYGDDGRYDDDPNPYAGTYDEDDCANDGNEMDPYEWGDGSEDSRFDYDEY